MEKNYRNLGFLILLFIPLTFFGFYKSYFVQFPDFEEVEFYIHLHVVLSSFWLLLLIVQPLLIRYKRNKLHRQLGRFSYVLFAFILLSLVFMAINGYNKGDNLLLTIANTLLLVLFYLLGIYHKKNTAKHMRYMIALVLVFVQPTLARIMIFWFGTSFVPTIHGTFFFVDAILLLLIFWDKAKNRNSQPYWLALCAFIGYQLVFYFL